MVYSIGDAKSREEAGSIREGNTWVCKWPTEDGLVCDKTFSCSKKGEFEKHRLDEHSLEGPLPILQRGPRAILTEAEKNKKHAARQAKYAAKKGAAAMKEMKENSVRNNLTEKYRKEFDAKYPRSEAPRKPALVLPGIMSFVSNGLSWKS
jgi:hypothetical protein